MKSYKELFNRFFKEKLKLQGKIFLYTFFVMVLVLALYITVTQWDETIFEKFGWEDSESIWFTFFIFSLILLIGSLLTMAFVRRLTINLKRLNRTAEMIGRGDLTKKDIKALERRFPDETDELSDSINLMLSNLRELVSLLKGTSSKIHDSSDFMMDSVENLNNYGSNLNVSMNDILNGARKQKDMVGVAIKNIRDMAQAIIMSSESADKASHAMSNTNKTAKTGEELAKEAIGRMKTIFDQVESSGKAVSSFVEKFNEINKIVGFITGIAQKTNLLALNASIEAARAGEMGKGFAIVAEEIRKLADSTSKSASQISELVKSFEKESEELIATIQETIKGIEENRTDVGIIVNSLENIVKNVGEVSPQVDAISKLSKEQTSLVDNVVNSSESVLDIAERNAQQTIQMSVVFSKEMGAIDKIRSNAMNMSDLSSSLQEIVSKFKTTEDS